MCTAKRKIYLVSKYLLRSRNRVRVYGDIAAVAQVRHPSHEPRIMIIIIVVVVVTPEDSLTETNIAVYRRGVVVERFSGVGRQTILITNATTRRHTHIGSDLNKCQNITIINGQRIGVPGWARASSYLL